MTSPPAEPGAQALGESLAALAVQVAALRGQIAQINQCLDRAGLRGDLDLAARFEELARTVADALDAAAPRGPAAPYWIGLDHQAYTAQLAELRTVGRYRAASALLRLRAAGLLAQPHSCRLGTVHPGRRMAPRLRRPAPRPGSRPGVLRPVAARHHAPHHRHHRQVHAALRDATDGPLPVTALPKRLRDAHGVVPAEYERSGLRGSARPGSLQHELPLAAQAVVAGSCCRDLEGCCRAAVRRRRCRIRGPGVRRAGLPVVRGRAAAAVGPRAGTGDPAARRRQSAAEPAPGPVRRVPRDAHLAAVLDGVPARGRRRRHRCGGGRISAARHRTRGSARTWRPAAPATGLLVPGTADICAVQARAGGQG